MKLADKLGAGVWSLTLLITALCYPRLPAQVATHFDWHGAPNSWQPRAIFALLLPGIALALGALLRFVGTRVSGADRTSRPWLAALITLFLSALHLFLLAFALDDSFNVLRGVGVAAGAFFVALGLLLPRLRRNLWVGVRAWHTLRSPEAWARAQRLAARMFCIGGAATMVLAWIAPTLGTLAVLLTAVSTAIVSTWYARTIQ